MDNMREFMNAMLNAFPDATVEEDNDGQLVIYTNLRAVPSETVAAGDPVPDTHMLVVPMDDAVTCDGCDAISLEGGWGDSPFCIDCTVEGTATEGELCEEHQRTYYNHCPLNHEDEN